MAALFVLNQTTTASYIEIILHLFDLQGSKRRPMKPGSQ